MSLSGLEGTGIPSLSLGAKGTSRIQSAWGGSGGQGVHGIKLTGNGSPQRPLEGPGEEEACHSCWVATPQMEPSSVCLPAPPRMEMRADRRGEWPVPSLPQPLALRELGFFLPSLRESFLQPRCLRGKETLFQPRAQPLHWPVLVPMEPRQRAH